MSKALCSSRCLIQAAKFYSPPLPLFPLSLLFHQHASFSTTFPLAVRKRKGYAKRRHNNPHRGESALRRTGLSHAVGMSKEPLPVPVLDPRKRTKVVADPKHGLWGFFNEKKELLTPPDQELRHGRAWTVNELRSKSWEDLHALWYTCIKEHNRMATEEYERKRMQLRVGEWEANERTRVIRKTQKNIKQALTERWYAWEAAWKIAETDPEVDLNADPNAVAYEAPVYEGDAPKTAVKEAAG